jgi:glycosyltransferase involved in cell wall biosynthesis
LRSFLAQPEPPDEVIVVDDGSTDDTVEWLEREFGSAVRVARQEHSGVSAARRRGVLEARGDWIAFLDSDDEWAPGRMSVLRRAIDGLPDDVIWLFGNTRLVTDGGSSATAFDKYGLEPNAPLQIYDDSLTTQFPYQFSMLQSSLIRRSALMDAGCFVEGLTSSEDFLISFRAALHGRFAAVPNVVTHLYRTSDLSASSLNAAGAFGRDFHHARVLAFAEAIDQRGRSGWAEHYALSARAYCMAIAQEGRSDRKLALRALMIHPTVKSVVFAAAAMVGLGRLSGWRATALHPPPANGPL